MFCALAENPKFHLKSIFDRNFTLVKLLICFYNQLMLKLGHTRLLDHFREYGIPESLWLHKWLITVFILDFPVWSALRLWDNLLTEGIVYLVKFICALVKVYERKIVKMDLPDYAQFLKTFRDEVSQVQKDRTDYTNINIEVLIRRTSRIKVTASDLDQWTMTYLRENPLENPNKEIFRIYLSDKSQKSLNAKTQSIIFQHTDDQLT